MYKKSVPYAVVKNNKVESVKYFSQKSSKMMIVPKDPMTGLPMLRPIINKDETDLITDPMFEETKFKYLVKEQNVEKIKFNSDLDFQLVLENIKKHLSEKLKDHLLSGFLFNNKRFSADEQTCLYINGQTTEAILALEKPNVEFTARLTSLDGQKCIFAAEEFKKLGEACSAFVRDSSKTLDNFKDGLLNEYILEHRENHNYEKLKNIVYNFNF